MGNWYKEINFEIKDNTNTINTIVEWLSNNYIIDKNCLKVNKKANSFDYYGNEFNIGISLKDKPHCLVLPKELFKDLTINFPQCIYDATASIENNNCSVNEEYFISVNNKTFKIEVPVMASIYYPNGYDNYEEFCDDNGDYISKEDFEKYKSESIIYVDDYKKIYTEKQYYDNKKIMYEITIKELVNEKDCTEDRILEKIKNRDYDSINLTDNQKNNRAFIEKIIEINPYCLKEIASDFILDKELAIKAIKKDPYCLDFIKVHKDDFEELNKISEKLLEED